MRVVFSIMLAVLLTGCAAQDRYYYDKAGNCRDSEIKNHPFVKKSLCAEFARPN